jgi:LemA protein
MPTYLIIGILILIAAYLFSTYNWFVTAKTRIKASIQEIGNQLKRQADLIPNLESSAKGYLKHEKGIFKDLTEARKAVSKAAETGDLGQVASAQDMLSNVLPKLQVVVESNPEIKGSDVVTKLMNELRDTSDKVMYARRTLIDLVADYNIKIKTLPSNLVAQLFGFKEEAGLKMAEASIAEATEVKTGDTQTPQVKLD